MTSAETGNRNACFGPYLLDLVGRELFCGTDKLRVGRQPLEILCALASADGRVVDKDALLARLWPGRAVEEGNLHVHVSALRRALGENGHSYVVTVPGRGYRLSGLLAAGQAGTNKPGIDAGVPPDNQTTGSYPGASGQYWATANSQDTQDCQPRQLTILSCELTSSVATRPNGEGQDGAAGRVCQRCGDVVASFGGRMIQVSDRVILGYFGYPRAGEHDTEQAIRAGLALLEAVREFDDLTMALQVRVGIATGPVVIRELVKEGLSAGGFFGEPIALAAALRRSAMPGTVIVAESSRLLVGDLFAVEKLENPGLDEFDGPVASFRVIRPASVASRFRALRGHALPPIIGRNEEIDLLSRRWQQAKAGELRVVLITGEAGIGKSRLCVEFRKRIRHERHVRLEYICSPHHQDTVLYPVACQLQAAAGFQHGDNDGARFARLRALLARNSSASDEDIGILANMLSLGASRVASADHTARRLRDLTFAALRRQLDALSIMAPVLILFEDAHWSDPTTLELLDQILRNFTNRPILVLATFRPEFTAPWTGQSQVTTLTLSRLDHRDGAALARGVAGGHALSNDLIDAIVDRTDGVPLFIEELTKAVLEGAELQCGPAVPATLQASLMARLERLPHAKQVAQAGAVIGRSFSHEMLAEVSGLSKTQLEKGLDELLTAGLVTASGRVPESTYTFKHALVQDVAYESLSRSQRARIHAALVVAGEEARHGHMEPGLLAYHSAQAGLIAKAAYHYRMAAESSSERAAILETKRQLQYGLGFAANLPAGAERDALEAELLLALATVLQTTAGMSNPEARQLFKRATAASYRSARPQLVSRALWGQFTHVLVRGGVAAAREHAEQLLSVAQACTDVQSQLAARAAMGISAYYQGHFVAARKHLASHQTILETQSGAPDLDWRTMTAGPAFLALTLACLGYPAQATAQLERAITLASRRGSLALAYALSVAVRVLIVLRDDNGLREHATSLIGLSETGGFHQFLNQGLCALGWLEARTTARHQYPDKLHDGLAGMTDLATFVCLPFYRSLLAQRYLRNGKRPEALRSLDDALELSDRTGDTWFTAELCRMRGELLDDPTDTETELHRSIMFARRQSARLFELRSSTSLARLWMKQDRHSEAQRLLAPVYAWFTEGADTPDLNAARQVLDGLAAHM